MPHLKEMFILELIIFHMKGYPLRTTRAVSLHKMLFSLNEPIKGT
uniref:Uncharacterized protein n=1 Tax=Anguilla anguilla TaxID=7936 RepID=A0A0E9SKJ7_ANGAN